MKHSTFSFIFAIIATLLLGSNAFAQQITQRGTSTTSTVIAPGQLITIATPTGVQPGDVMIVNIMQTSSLNVGALANATNPNWTLISGSALGSGNTNRSQSTILYRIAGNSEPANYSFTLAANTNSASGGLLGFFNVSFTGVTHTGAAGGPFDVTPTATISTSGGAENDDVLCTQINGVTAGAAIVMLSHCRDNSSFDNGDWTAGTPVLTEAYDVSNSANAGSTAGAAWAIRTTGGNTSAGDADLSSNELWGAMLLALKPIPFGPIGCNGQFYVSNGPTSGFSGNTLLNKLVFSGSTLSASSFPVNPGSMGFNSIGLNPLDGFIYAVRYPNGVAKAHLIRMGAGYVNQVDLGEIAALNTTELSYSGCFDKNGDYYFTTNSGTGGGRLMKITNANLAARIATQVAASGFSSIYDIAINPVTEQMFATNSNTGVNFLNTVNKTDGTITNIVSANSAGGNFFAGLFFDEVGELYGYRANGSFFRINKTTAELTPAGSGSAYDGADGCSCSFGRVYHDLDFTLNPDNQVCPSQFNPTFPFSLTVSVTNQTSGPQTGLTYTLNMTDPAKRLKFTETAPTILANFISAGLATGASTVTLSAANPGDPINKLVITGFQTGATTSTLSVVLQVAVATTGGVYINVPLQSEITGLDPVFGSNDLSNDPTSIPPDDKTIISFCPNITLPVSLLSFNGSLKNDATLLNWTAENQINFAYYRIERSSNAVDFTDIGSKPAQNNNTSSRENYQFTDDLSAVPGNVFYYRLRMIDMDGTFKYSNVIVVRKDVKSIIGMLVNPNPVLSDNSATVRFEATAKGTVNFMVVDMAGRVILTQQNNVAEGVNSISLNKLDRLQPGVYLLQMNDGKATQTAKFTVAR